MEAYNGQTMNGACGGGWEREGGGGEERGWGWGRRGRGEGSLREVAKEVLRKWEELRNDVDRIMSKYHVMVCGYCPEVHVGGAGHKVR
ncbi:unnamed protein product [Closterium sp. NIES-53]